MYFDCIRDDVEGGGGAKFQRRLCEALGWLTFGCRLELVKRNLVATIRKSYALQMFITTTIHRPGGKVFKLPGLYFNPLF